jgi:L-threonylcarbamoyladenylate synthase
MTESTISNAVSAMRRGGVIAYPTEGVWGLGCDPFSEKPVMQLLALKQREVEKGLIVVAADDGQIRQLLDDLDNSLLMKLKETWPGPNTWLLPDPNQSYPDWIKGKFATIAVRVSAHPVVIQLCRAFGGPIVSTSANPATQPPALTLGKVLEYFPGQLDALVPGELGGQKGPSIIRDLVKDAVLRS